MGASLKSGSMIYNEAYNKIIEAYFKDEIKPYDSSFCFCGTLADNTAHWFGSTLGRFHRDYAGYKGLEYLRMERALLDTIQGANGDYETLLFLGMSAALDVLKQIHIER